MIKSERKWASERGRSSSAIPFRFHHLYLEAPLLKHLCDPFDFIDQWLVYNSWTEQLVKERKIHLLNVHEGPNIIKNSSLKSHINQITFILSCLFSPFVSSSVLIFGILWSLVKGVKITILCFFVFCFVLRHITWPKLAVIIRADDFCAKCHQ